MKSYEMTFVLRFLDLTNQSLIFRHHIRMTIVPENEYIKKNRIIISGEDNALIDNLERKILFPANEKVDEKCKSDSICLLLSHVYS